MKCVVGPLGTELISIQTNKRTIYLRVIVTDVLKLPTIAPTGSSAKSIRCKKKKKKNYNSEMLEQIIPSGTTALSLSGPQTD